MSNGILISRDRKKFDEKLCHLLFFYIPLLFSLSQFFFFLFLYDY